MIHYHGTRSAGARLVAELMGSRQRLKIQRPGPKRRYSWERSTNRHYQAWRDRDMVRIGRLPHLTSGDCKERMVRTAGSVPDGATFRLVDAHGKSYGPRFTAPTDLVEALARVRLVERQEEDMHSQLIRQRNRLHRSAMKD